MSQTKSNIGRIIAQHWTQTEKDLWKRINFVFQGEFSLRQRLERLMDCWGMDEFLGRPYIARIVQLRNIKPHGRGRELSPEIAQEMLTLLLFLCALGRIYVLKALGCDRRAISAGFKRCRYPHLAPRKHG